MYFRSILYGILKYCLLMPVFLSSYVYCAQIDTIKIINTRHPPVIDGNENDRCWKLTNWIPIDEVWITWGSSIEKSDFTGDFKVAWSETENLLYFLIRTVDDILVDSYVPGVTADIYNFDILEVFIDEDHSKGPHIFDDEILGENAENAFAYHIHCRFPFNGETTDSIRVQDIAGTGWDNRIDPVYNHHFEDFKIRLLDNVVYWEFSLKVYDDTYINNAPENSRVTLSEDKIMGLSLAYCDNDDINENPATRDNFIGSVWVPEKAYNDHWENSDYFGVAQLIADTTYPSSLIANNSENISIFPNPLNDDMLNVQLNIIQAESSFIYDIYSLDGILVYSNVIHPQRGKVQINIPALTPGVYLFYLKSELIQANKILQVIQ